MPTNSLLAKNLNTLLSNVDKLTSGQMIGNLFFYTWGPDLEANSVVEVTITKTPGAKPTRCGSEYAHWGSNDDHVELTIYTRAPGHSGRVYGWAPAPGLTLKLTTRTEAKDAYLGYVEQFIRLAARVKDEYLE